MASGIFGLYVGLKKGYFYQAFALIVLIPRFLKIFLEKLLVAITSAQSQLAFFATYKFEFVKYVFLNTRRSTLNSTMPSYLAG